MVLHLGEFVIIVIIPSGLRSQALSDLLTQFTSKGCGPLYEDLPCEEIFSVEKVECHLSFDVSSTWRKWGRDSVVRS